MIKSTLISAVSFSLLSLNAQALSVGEMKVNSYLGDPLNISIDVNSLTNNELSTLEVELASRDLFRQAGIDYPASTNGLSITVQPNGSNTAIISVRSAGAVSAPFVHLLLNIKWAGGSVLREYAALLDPSDYKPTAIAAAPSTNFGLVKKPLTPSKVIKPKQTDPGFYGRVKSGDTLSRIADLYRPSGVSANQSWVAFYNLNKNAFSGGNINNIKLGAQIRVPTDDQMRAVSRADAYVQVQNLSKPLRERRTELPRAPEPVQVVIEQKPELTIGGNTAQTNNAQTSNQQASQSNDALDAFKKTVARDVSASLEQNSLLKEELISTRGENKVLSDRLARLESQLEKISTLLELQGNALQIINQAGFVQQNAPSVAPSPPVAQPAPVVEKPVEVVQQPEPKIEKPAEVVQPPAPVVQKPAEIVQQPAPVAQQSNTSNTIQAPANKTAYDDLVERALSKASSSDKSYIDTLNQEASTSIGLPDNAPVIQQQAPKPVTVSDLAGKSPEEQQAIMLANVRSSLGLQANVGSSTSTASESGNINKEELAYIESLNDTDRSSIDKGKARIALLEQQLEAKVKAALESQQAQVAANINPVSTEQAEVASQPAQAPQDIMGKAQFYMGKAQQSLYSAKETASELPAETWKLLGGGAAALLGLFVLFGRRRNEEDLFDDDDLESNSTFTFNDDPSSFNDDNQHGSSLFDLSDESFMASEGLDNESSLFALDELDEMFTAVDEEETDDFQVDIDAQSEVTDQQSTVTHVVDVDPVAEAEVYLAYDRKEEAIEVLRDAFKTNPNQADVATKLLSLYQGADNKRSFSELFESAVRNIEDQEGLENIRQLAREYIPDHQLFADDFDASIPLLTEEIQGDSSARIGDSSNMEEKPVETASLDDDDASLTLDLYSDSSIELDLSEDEGSVLAFDSNLEELDDEGDDEVLSLTDGDAHDPDISLSLAKAYIDLGELTTAKDFLNDVFASGADEALKAEAQTLLDSIA